MRRYPRDGAWIIHLDRGSAGLGEGPSIMWSVLIAVATFALIVAAHH